jgi:pilus assembly protein CpaE
MRALIVGDNHERTSVLGQVLDQAGVAHSTKRPTLFSVSSRLDWEQEGSPDLLFFVGEFESEIDTELIREARRKYDGAIVVVANVPSHAAIIQTIRAGATDFIDIDSNLSEEVAAILSSLHTKVDTREQGELTTVLPCGDPSDANFVSANLAVSVAQRRGGCMLLDFHLRGGELCHLLQLVPRHSVLDLLRVREEVDQAMFEQALLTHDSHVRLLAGPELFSDLRDIRPSVGQRLIALARATSPCVISQRGGCAPRRTGSRAGQ